LMEEMDRSLSLIASCTRLSTLPKTSTPLIFWQILNWPVFGHFTLGLVAERACRFRKTTSQLRSRNWLVNGFLWSNFKWRQQQLLSPLTGSTTLIDIIDLFLCITNRIIDKHQLINSADHRLGPFIASRLGCTVSRLFPLPNIAGVAHKYSRMFCLSSS